MVLNYFLSYIAEPCIIYDMYYCFILTYILYLYQ